jgi:pimeloyl-ACP methyl ester carboxylesterase
MSRSPARLARYAVPALAALALGLGFGQARAQDAAGLQREVVFDAYTPLAGNPELFRRLLSPLAAAMAQQKLAAGGQVLTGQSIDLAQERYVVYAPAQPPPQGYGLLVFVPPWPQAGLPADWAPVLDRFGLIFVSAARSGNEENAFGRRAPLALLAVPNIMKRYKVDPARVYVGGFSGGSRVALRLAVAYPDVFKGALLNAGADPIGGGIAPPPRPLLEAFQASTRLVYVTGERDKAARNLDADSQRSMHRWCVDDLASQATLWTGHEPANAGALGRALTALQQHTPPSPARLAACRAEVQQAADAELARAATLIAAGKREAARKLLLKTDLAYGGLAAPRSLDLARACGCGLL